MTKLKPVHLIKSKQPIIIEDKYYFFTTCGIARHRVYNSWFLREITCKNCLKTKQVRKQIVNRLLQI